MKKTLIVIFSLFGIHIALSQEKNINTQMFSLFDKTIGANNTKLSYGTVFKERYRRKLPKNHNYFKNELFSKGSINYRGERFYDINIKYDIVDDFLVAKIINHQRQVSIVPEKSLVSEFKLNGHTFINSYNVDIGFLEQLVVSNGFSVLKKHRKVSKENKDRKYRYYTFKKKGDQYYVHYLKNFYSVHSSKDFVKIFPNDKKRINKFFKKNRFLYRNDFTNFVTKLMKQLLV
ncbi:hypothetical protein SAMN04489761_3983 [Tenacibaculum sp. MAR_2009_124]|uniref:hypothetical protein n=1 Tax=Tenacibaculum sp. MAR_2009_124 TaxID=1250059 RepID=UPI00089639C6|nr:hypothetical protein [Tenacibaculum sp. MAR_2009_124]SEC92549.1 hypothetical protein SAMN04489761_3983 [Tenacibaculum sp. MAR_2009_124]